MHANDRTVSVKDAPGVRFGAAIGGLAVAGRDKLTIVTHPDVRAFGAWAEQLIAESTGKHGKGIVPIAGEPLGAPDVYGDDRLFVYVGANLPDPDNGVDDALRALEAAGHPVVRLDMNDEYDLGEQFYLWEIAVAAAGAILGINAFDQPNVQESKDNTVALLAQYAQKGSFDEPAPDVEGPKFDVTFLSGSKTIRAQVPVPALSGVFAQMHPHDYAAITAYIARNETHEGLLEELRLKIRDACKVATTVGFGPRFLHSTGQLHKGGPDTCVMLQIVADDPDDFSDSRHERRIPDAAGGAGAGRLAVARQTQPARRARASQRRRRGRAARADRRGRRGALGSGMIAAPPSDGAAVNPLRAGLAERSHHGAVQHRLLRRERRSVQTHAAAGDLLDALGRNVADRFRAGRLLRARNTTTIRFASTASNSSTQFMPPGKKPEGHVWDDFAKRIRYIRPISTITTTSSNSKHYSRATTKISARPATTSSISPRRRRSSRSSCSASRKPASIRNPEGGGWTRIIVEKPFGTDLASARALQHEIDKVFPENGRLPHRPLSRQGAGARHHGAALRQHDLRADLESQLRRQRADHGGGDRSASKSAAVTTIMPARCAT